MLGAVKRAVGSALPQAIRTWVWWLTDADYRNRRQEHLARIYALRRAQNRAGQEILRQNGTNVLSGPFRGLIYVEQLGGNVPTQKILGTYEKELWPVVEEIASRNYERIVDIGAAEGYYVCGLAKRIPQAKVVAFEAQRACHVRIEELARLNSVLERVECRGLCQSADLRKVFAHGQRTVIVCDVEGAEFELLDPATTPDLLSVDILVEVHDHLRPAVGEELIRRFQSTHNIRVIPSTRRTIDDMPSAISLPENLALAAMEESRGGEMVWHWMRRK